MANYKVTHLIFINTCAFVLNFIVTYAVGMGRPFGWDTISEVSNEYTSLLTPASWAFSIWGVIFFGEFLFSLWQLFSLCTDRENVFVLVDNIGYLWAAACIVQTAWTPFFVNRMLFVAALCLSILSILLGMVCLRICEPLVCGNGMWQHTCWFDFFAMLPFQIHFGWTLAASVLNWNLVCIQLGAPAHMQHTIAYLSLFILFILAINATIGMRGGFVLAVAAYALIAIYFNLSTSDGNLRQGKDVHITFSGSDIEHIRIVVSILGFLCLLLVVMGMLDLPILPLWKR